ncbi:X-linked retinitis pigmentosa GTPase regulator [Amphibalanus amphitrite]|uniref:X-linked retinitis pigmentosa GTPase regulator n=1 Tax=Amphibalanus amphitrite TaxID=1232801 RepID=A0A6A4WP25_AMPAM|nr:X-linked retinitis pigmentosa GTPase regulator [Amphibalanus amphitrite]
MAIEHNATLRVYETGAVLTFGRSRFNEKPGVAVLIKNDPIIACACGDEHTVVIAASHRVFSFGSNEFGQLGLGHTKSVTRPSCVKDWGRGTGGSERGSMERHGVHTAPYSRPGRQQHAAADRSRCAMADHEELPETGAVLTFGRSRFNENQASRFWIKNDPIIACACGDEHTVVIAASHRVFSFGSNEFGQLGLGHTKSVTRPSCVKAHGQLFAWGSNEDGQCGLGDAPGACLPTPVPSDEEIVSLSCGYRHTAFVTGQHTWHCRCLAP